MLTGEGDEGGGRGAKSYESVVLYKSSNTLWTVESRYYVNVSVLDPVPVEPNRKRFSGCGFGVTLLNPDPSPDFGI